MQEGTATDGDLCLLWRPITTSSSARARGETRYLPCYAWSSAADDVLARKARYVVPPQPAQASHVAVALSSCLASLRTVTTTLIILGRRTSTTIRGSTFDAH